MADQTTEIRRIAREITDTQRRLSALERGTSLDRASIEGAGVPVYDDEGNLRQTIGQQDDGSYTVRDWNGPPPPVPTDPIVETVGSSLVVTWDGAFQLGRAAPLDWSHVEVHVSLVSGFTPDDGTQVATINSVKGGQVVLGLPARVHYVRLVSVSTSGAESLPSDQVSGTPVLAPTVSPTPTVQGTVGALLVSWPPVPGSPVAIEVHLSTDPAFVPVQGAAATLVRAVNGTGTTIRALPDGSPLEYTTVVDPATSPPTTGPRVYYVRTIAVNETGVAPPSAVGSGSMVQVDSPDIAVNAAWVGTMLADRIEGGNLHADVAVVGSMTAQGAAGEQVSLSGDGFRVLGPDSLGNPVHVEFPTDGGRPNIVGGELNASVLSVSEGATIRGPSAIESETTVELASKVAAPKTAPLVMDTWDSLALGMTAPDGTVFATVVGAFCRGPDRPGPTPETPVRTMWGCVGTGAWEDGATHVAEWNWDTGEMLQAFRPAGWGTAARARGIVRGRGMFFVLQQSGGGHCFIDTYTEEWVRLAGNRVLDAADRGGREAIGWDWTGDWPVLGYIRSTGRPTRVRYTVNLISGVLTAAGSVQLAVDPYRQSALGFIGVGAFDYGAERVVYVTTWSSQGERWRVCPNTGGGASNQSEEWVAAEQRHVFGGYWDPSLGQFFSVSENARRYTYLGGEALWTSGPGTWWVGATFIDSKQDLTAVPPNERHETNLSPQRQWQKAKRSSFTVTVPPVPTGAGGPDTPNRAGVWVAKSNAAPPLTAYTLRVEIEAPAETWTWAGQPPAPWTSGPLAGQPITGAAVDLTVNTFPEVGAATIRGSTPRADGYPTLELRGDGGGRWDHLIPPGAMMMWAGPAAPPGWLLCQGQVLNTTDFPDLFAALGGASSPFGVNTAAGTFTLPDLRGRFPIGASGTYSRGQRGGSATADINQEHTPPHAHDMTHDHPTNTSSTAGSHDHELKLASDVGPDNARVRRGEAAMVAQARGAVNHDGDHAHNVNVLTSTRANTGDASDVLGQTPLPVLNPYQAINYIIRF